MCNEKKWGIQYIYIEARLSLKRFDKRGSGRVYMSAHRSWHLAWQQQMLIL